MLITVLQIIAVISMWCFIGSCILRLLNAAEMLNCKRFRTWILGCMLWPLVLIQILHDNKDEK